MSINFNRSRAQVYLENLIDNTYNVDSTSKEQKKDFKNRVKTYTISSVDALALEEKLLLDAKDYFYNGLISLIEGINNVYKKSYSWGVVKLYYSLFYACRSYMAYKKICIFRALEVFRLDVSPNSSFTGGGKEYKNTHKSVLNYFKSAFPSHYILSNEIDGSNALDWYEEVRNIVNYRASRFYEPKYLDILKKYENGQNLIEVIQDLIKDDVGNIFIEDFALLGIPLKFFSLMIKELSLDENIFDSEDLDYLGALSHQNCIDLLDYLW